MMFATWQAMKRERMRKRQLEQAAGLRKPSVMAVKTAAQELAAEPGRRGWLGAGVAVVRITWSLMLDAVWLVAILVVVVVAAQAAGWEHPAVDVGNSLISKLLKILEGAMPGESNR
jgi:hypothetical protein